MDMFSKQTQLRFGRWGGSGLRCLNIKQTLAVVAYRLADIV
jgi:hypothetical protein